MREALIALMALFLGLDPVAFSATFVVEGDTAVSVASLKTNQGLQTSSLPSATLGSQ